MSDCENNLICSPCELPTFDFSLQDYPVYRNEEQTFIIPCPPGYVCLLDEISITIPAGTVEYRPVTSGGNGGGSGSGGSGIGSGSSPGSGSTPGQTVQDMAHDKAVDEAYKYLRPRPKVYFNEEVTASCDDGAIGGVPPGAPFYDGSGGVLIPAGVFSSPVSQLAADEAAKAQADGILQAYGDCHWENTEQSETAYCEEEGKFGDPVTKTVNAGTFSSTISQADADQKAKDDALSQAEAELVCYDFQNAEYTATCPDGYVGSPVTIPEGSYFSNVSQADADQQAIDQADSELDCELQCALDDVNALIWVHSGGGTGAADGAHGTIHADGSSSQSILTTSLTNNCSQDYTINVKVDSSLSTNNTGVVAKTEIVFNFVQVAISSQNLPGPGPTCYPKNESIAAQLTLSPGNSVVIVVQCYEQGVSGCSGANGIIEIEIL